MQMHRAQKLSGSLVGEDKQNTTTGPNIETTNTLTDIHHDSNLGGGFSDNVNVRNFYKGKISSNLSSNNMTPPDLSLIAKSMILQSNI